MLNIKLSLKDLSLKDPLTRIVLITIAILFGVYFSCQKLVVKPHKQKLSRLTQKLEHAKLEDDIGNLYKEVKSYEKVLPEQKDVSWLREQITELAQKSKLYIISIEPLATQKINPYLYVSFKLKISCAYSQLLEFIHLIESSNKLITIENLDLKIKKEYKLELSEKEHKEPPKETLAEVEIVIGTVY